MIARDMIYEQKSRLNQLLAEDLARFVYFGGSSFKKIQSHNNLSIHLELITTGGPS